MALIRIGTAIWEFGAVLGLGLALVACQTEPSATSGAGEQLDSDPIAVGDTGPGGCTAGSVARTNPVTGQTACFYGGGCPDGQVPVRIDTAAGSTVQCGWLEADTCGAGWLVGGGIADGAALCLPQPPCATPVNVSEERDGAYTLALDCSAG